MVDSTALLSVYNTPVVNYLYEYKDTMLTLPWASLNTLGYIVVPNLASSLVGISFITTNSAMNSLPFGSTSSVVFSIDDGTTTTVLTQGSWQQQSVGNYPGFKYYVPFTTPPALIVGRTYTIWGCITGSNTADMFLAETTSSLANPQYRPGFDSITLVYGTSTKPVTTTSRTTGIDLHFSPMTTDEEQLVSYSGSIDMSTSLQYVKCISLVSHTALRLLKPGMYSVNLTLYHTGTATTPTTLSVCAFGSNNLPSNATTSWGFCSNLLADITNGDFSYQPAYSKPDGVATSSLLPIVGPKLVPYKNNVLDYNYSTYVEINSQLDTSTVWLVLRNNGSIFNVSQLYYTLTMKYTHSPFSVSEPPTPTDLTRYGVEPNPGPWFDKDKDHWITMDDLKGWVYSNSMYDVREYRQRAKLLHKLVVSVFDKAVYVPEKLEITQFPKKIYQIVYDYLSAFKVDHTETATYIESVVELSAIAQIPAPDLTQYGIEPNPGPTHRIVKMTALLDWIASTEASNTTYFAARRALLSKLDKMMRYSSEIPDGYVEIDHQSKRAIWSFLDKRNDSLSDDSRLAFLATVERLLDSIELVSPTRPATPEPPASPRSAVSVNEPQTSSVMIAATQEQQKE